MAQPYDLSGIAQPAGRYGDRGTNTELRGDKMSDMPSEIRTADDPQYRRLKALRDDALARGMDGLAAVYGWSLMDLGATMIQQNRVVLDRQMRELR